MGYDETSSLVSSGRSVRERRGLIKGDGKAEEEQDVQESQARMGFFGLSAICMMAVACVGCVIAKYTGSDLVLVDFWDMIADIVGLILSLGVEFFKQTTLRRSTNPLQSRRTLLAIDVFGGVVSFMLLCGVMTFGFFAAEAEISGEDDTLVTGRRWILFYAVLSIVSDLIPLYVFRSSVLQTGGEDANKLNMLSGILHMGIDLLRAVVTIISSIYMLLIPVSPIDNVIDGYGTVGICILVLCSAFYVAGEAATSIREVMEISVELGMEKDAEAAQDAC